MRMTPPAKAPKAHSGEEGYIFLGVLFLLVMVLITLSIAAPKVAADIERDREIELQHRGKQYQRAIQLYYRKFGTYPPNIEALEKSNNIRFLRKRYKDPATGKDEWKLIHFGENKTPAAMGFFGQPLAGTGGGSGSVLAGTGPGGTGGQSIGSPFGSQGSQGAQGGMTFGGAPLPNSPTTTPTAPTDPSNPTASAAGTAGTAGTTDPNSSLGSNTASTFSGSNTASTTSGQTFGGGGIIGVESTSPKATILEYKKKKHFNEWEFVYSPLSERQTFGGGAVGQPMSGAGNGGTPSFGSGSFGNNGGSFGGQGGSAFGSPSQGQNPGSNPGTGSQPPAPQPQPQQ